MDQFRILKQPLRLTNGVYRLDVHQKRIILRIIQAFQSDVKRIMDKKVSVSETLLGDRIITIPTRFLLPEGSKNHKILKYALSSLPTKRISIKQHDEKGIKCEIDTAFILKSKFFHRNQLVEFQIDRDMLPIYLDITKGWTKFLLVVAFNLSSSHTIRLYERVSHWYDKKDKEHIIYFDEIKRKLGIEEKYVKSSLFKQKVLEPASIELKEKADVYFQIEEAIKKGRKIIGWKITIHKREEEEPKSQQSPKEKQVASLPQGTPQESEISVDPEKLQKVKTLFHQKLVDPTNPNSKFKKLKNHAKTID